MSDSKPTTNAEKRQAVTAIFQAMGTAIQTNNQVLVNLTINGLNTLLLEVLPDEVPAPVKTTATVGKTIVKRGRKPRQKS